MEQYTLAVSQGIVDTQRCGECGSRLINPWGGAYGVNGHIVRCSKDPEHRTFKPYRVTKKLADGRDYDVQTQRPVDEHQALARLTTEKAMMERTRQALAGGLFPGKLTHEQSVAIAQIALAYGLDPLMGEIIFYQGRPYITIDGRRRLDANAGHRPGIKFRPLTPEEKELYSEGGALEPGDLALVCVLTSEHGQAVEAFGRVLARERSGNPHLPLVSRAIEMAQKRAEYRARRMAYGPVAIPQGIRPEFLPIEEGDVVEGQAREVEGFAPQVAATGEILAPDEAPDEMPVPEAFKAVVERAGNHQLTAETFCQKVLPRGVNTFEDYVRMGGTPELAEQRLNDWIRKAG